VTIISYAEVYVGCEAGVVQYNSVDVEAASSKSQIQLI
jgi:hypothetical protein